MNNLKQIGLSAVFYQNDNDQMQCSWYDSGKGGTWIERYRDNGYMKDRHITHCPARRYFPEVHIWNGYGMATYVSWPSNVYFYHRNKAELGEFKIGGTDYLSVKKMKSPVRTMAFADTWIAASATSSNTKNYKDAGYIMFYPDHYTTDQNNWATNHGNTGNSLYYDGHASSMSVSGAKTYGISYAVLDGTDVKTL